MVEMVRPALRGPAADPPRWCRRHRGAEELNGGELTDDVAVLLVSEVG